MSGRTAVIAAAIAAAVTLPDIAAAQGERPQVSSVREIGAAIMRCWRPPDGTMGWEVTLRFMLTHTGSVRGQPMITYSKLPGPLDLQKRFVAAAIATIADCTPLDMSDALRASFGERLLSLRLQNQPRQTPL